MSREKLLEARFQTARKAASYLREAFHLSERGLPRSWCQSRDFAALRALATPWKEDEAVKQQHARNREIIVAASGVECTIRPVLRAEGLVLSHKRTGAAVSWGKCLAYPYASAAIKTGQPMPEFPLQLPQAEVGCWAIVLHYNQPMAHQSECWLFRSLWDISFVLPSRLEQVAVRGSGGGRTWQSLYAKPGRLPQYWRKRTTARVHQQGFGGSWQWKWSAWTIAAWKPTNQWAKIESFNGRFTW